jgi:hypothetical protein
VRKQVEALKHDEASRKNIPTAEYQSLIEKENQTPIQVAYERRNRDLDPQLVWRGKDKQDWSDLVVPAPPLYIQEKVAGRRPTGGHCSPISSSRWRVRSAVSRPSPSCPIR